MRENRIAAHRGYRAIRYRYTKPAMEAPNRLLQQFVMTRPDAAWVTDITYIRTLQGWLYLAVVLDLFSRKMIGWSMKATLAKEIVLEATLMAVWRRKPMQPVIIHPAQGLGVHKTVRSPPRRFIGQILTSEYLIPSLRSGMPRVAGRHSLPDGTAGFCYPEKNSCREKSAVSLPREL